MHLVHEDFDAGLGLKILTVSPVALFLKPYALFSVHRRKVLTYYIKFRWLFFRNKNDVHLRIGWKEEVATKMFVRI